MGPCTTRTKCSNHGWGLRGTSRRTASPCCAQTPASTTRCSACARGAGWWTKPTFATPTVPIAPDGTFSAEICFWCPDDFPDLYFEVGRTDYPPVYGLLKTAYPDFYLLGNYVTNWECYNPRHPLTRNESRSQLQEIFRYVQSKGILLTIEHHIDWAVPHIFSVRTRAAHSGVYGEDRAGPSRGIPVPLWQLVFHDCVYVTGDDYLYALLWGAQSSLNLPMPAERERVEEALLLARLHQAVGWDRMTDHKFLSRDYQVQETTFSSGAKVWVDLKQKKYRISGVPGIDPVERQAR